MTSRALSVVVTAPEGTLKNGVYHFSGAPNGGLGSVSLAPTGGVGAKSARFKETPAWASPVLNLDPDGEVEWTLGGDVALPPFHGMGGQLVVEISDSASPTPAKVEVSLSLDVPIPAGEVLLRPDYHAPLRFVPTDWPIVLNKVFTSGDETATMVVRRHADGRILVHAAHVDQYSTRYVDAFVTGPFWSEEQLCQELGQFAHSRCGGAVRAAVLHMAQVLPPVVA